MTGPQQERGVYRTTDGGAHWERVLFVDENTGCSGLTMDAKNPRVLFAGTWQVEMHTYGEFSGGPGSGVYMSRDGGATWIADCVAGAAAFAGGKNRRGGGAVQFRSRLCADSDRRPRLDVAIRRRRRELARGELGSRADRPRGLLHSPGGFAGE